MNSFFPRIAKMRLIEAALGIVLVQSPIHAEEIVSEDSLGFLSAPPEKGGKKLEQLPVENEIHNSPTFKSLAKNKDTYTINFNNVSIIEYIRFTSKITNLNFIFNEQELQFSVSIVSEEPVTPTNIMSILIQVLRINGLVVLEQDNNLLITRVRNVTQLATIVSGDLPEPGHRSPLVTRVFRIKNANLSTVASVVKPMLSDSALLEVSAETKQLIITDITTNVDKISTLLATIDSPHTSLEIDTYVAQNVSLDALIPLAKEIITPFSEGNQITFVPQADTSTIFIISTPYLIERTLTVLEDLDTPTKDRKDLATRDHEIFLYPLGTKKGPLFLESIGALSQELDARGSSYKLIDCLNGARWIKESNSILFVGDSETLAKVKELLPTMSLQPPHLTDNQQVFLYPLGTKKGTNFLDSIGALSQGLEARGAPEQLINCLNGARWIKESNSILFVGDSETLAKVKELLPTIGLEINPGTEKRSFYVYKIQHAPVEQLEESLDTLAQDLQKSPQPDHDLIEALTTYTYVKESNSLIFTGSSTVLAKLSETLPAFDVAATLSKAAPSHFLVYTPKKMSGTELQNSLEELADNLKASGLADPLFIQAIQSMKWTPSTQSLIFTGNEETLNQVKTLVTSIDEGKDAVRGGSTDHIFYLYKLKNASGSIVLDHVNQIAANLQESKVPNEPLILTLRNAKWVKDNNSLLLTGSPTAIEQARVLIEQFDVSAPPTNVLGNKSEFFIYKPVHAKGPVIESTLRDLSKDLDAAGLSDPDLLNTIGTMRYVDTTNSLLFTGTPASLEKVKALLERIDSLSPSEMQIQQLGTTTFLIYKIQYVPASQLISSLRNVTTDLQRTGAVDPNVATAISTLKWIKETNSLLITGTPETLQKVEALLKKFDVASLAPRPDSIPPTTSFVVYTPKYQPGEDLVQILEDFQHNLAASGVNNPLLFETISNLKYVPRTCSLIISGDAESIAKVEELLRRFDVPSSEPSKNPPSIESIQNTSFLIYKLQYHQGNEILTALKQIANDLGPGTATGNQNLLNAVNSLQWIRVTNSLLASGEADTLTKLRDLIQNLDVPLRQVFIEVLVIETNVNNAQNFGLQWGGKMKYLNKFAAGTGDFPAASTSPAASTNPVNPLAANGYNSSNSIIPGIQQTTATSFPNPNPNASGVGGIPLFSGFDFGVIGDIIMHKGNSFISIGSLVNALQTDTDSTVVLNPKIITQDNRTSTIFVGQNIPFIGSQVQTSANIVSSTNNIEYRDIGFNLTITPTIGNNDVVTLDINTDISQVTSNPNLTVSNTSNQTGQITGIQTSHTSMTTKVHVPDQHFVVLSGMISDQKFRSKSGLPCLGGLPVIGVLFSENDRSVAKQNLIFFIRPQVVNTYEEYRAITEHQEDVYKDQAVMPVLKEEFDAAIDIVKQPDDQ